MVGVIWHVMLLSKMGRGDLKYNHKQVISRAMLFDDQILVDLSDIAEEVCREARNRIFQNNGITEEKYYEFLSENENNTIDFDTYFKVKYQIESIDREFYAEFSSGSTIQTNDLDVLRQELRFLSSGVDRIRIETGRYNETRLSIDIGNGYGGTYFTISGSRAFVNDIASRLRERFAASEVDYAFFRNIWVSVVVSFIFGIFFMLFSIHLAMNMNEIVNNELRLVVSTLFVGIGVIVAIGAGYIYSISFPSIEFDYGVPRRRRRARLVLLVWMLSTICVPLVLKLVDFGN
ncbi:MFS transporter [Stakelama tenebrarum]|uniref:MFS transporter n=1 Tax=Stakelama tenebrarum TaxID=2711215 RepID=A0A6G6Y4E9_9SPHN|nr:MFS transporter [Sphingosinithalassobacter tenebrarum]QIG79824.1 MFS transporter [Sphingosinithalassobacter tenebrarum]